MSGYGGLVGGIIGAVIGMFTPIGPYWGWVIGSTLGALLFPPAGPDGPRLDDLTPQKSEYGAPIPIVYGAVGLGGNVIWASELIEQESEVGGKGSDGATQYSYYANFAVAVCEGEVSLGRIWAGPEKRLIYDPAGSKLESGAITFYSGSESQMPDPLMESYEGVGNVPAYRGVAYVVLENFALINDGNRIPFLTIEVGQPGTTAPVGLGYDWPQETMDAGDTFITIYYGSYSGFVQHRKSDLQMLHNRRMMDSTVGAMYLYHAPSDTLFQVHQALSYSTSLYATQQMGGVGAFSEHLPFVIPSGQALRGAAWVNGLLVLAVTGNGTGGAVSFYSIDPNTHELVGPPQVFDAGSTEKMVLHGLRSHGTSSSWAFGMTDGTVRRYDLDGASTLSVDLGAPPTGFTEGSTYSGGGRAMLDPYTGLLWICTQAIGSTTVYWTVHSHTLGRIYSSSIAVAFDVSPMAWTFVPATDGHGSRVWLGGDQWLATDSWQDFDANTGAAGSIALAGAYHGTGDIFTAIYNDRRDNIFCTRYGGWWNQTYLGDANPVDLTAAGYASIPAIEPLGGPLGGADASLNYSTLAEVVSDLCARAGLNAAEYDVSDLDETVDGYAVARVTSVREAIRALMPVYWFDAIESDGKVKFVMRGGDIAAAISDDELGAHDSGSAAPDAIETARVMENELPKTMTVAYLSAATNYGKATKYAARLVGSSGDEQTIEAPMVLTDTRAQQAADVNLHGAWVARLSYRFSLPRKYSYLEPTDLIALGSKGYTARLTKVTVINGRLQCEATHDDSVIYVPRVLVTETPNVEQSVSVRSPTTLELM